MYQEAHNCYECLNKVTYMRTYMEMLKRITTYQNKKKMIYENVVFVLFIFVCVYIGAMYLFILAIIHSLYCVCIFRFVQVTRTFVRRFRSFIV